jgi:hypothetical protein
VQHFTHGHCRHVDSYCMYCMLTVTEVIDALLLGGHPLSQLGECHGCNLDCSTINAMISFQCGKNVQISNLLEYTSIAVPGVIIFMGSHVRCFNYTHRTHDTTLLGARHFSVQHLKRLQGKLTSSTDCHTWITLTRPPR